MAKLRRYLNQHYLPAQKPWQIVLLSSLLVFFVLGIFQPFGFDRSHVNKWVVLIGFTLITAASTSLVGYVFPILFKKFYAPSRWTRGKNMLNSIIILLLIATGNFTFEWIVGNHSPSELVRMLLVYFIATLLVGVIPMVASHFLTKNQSLRRTLGEVSELNKQLLANISKAAKEVTEESDTAPLILRGSTKDMLEVGASAILYMESSGSYVSICYLAAREVKRKLLRTTIAQLAEDVEGYPKLARCHRAYIVNLAHVVAIKGSSQGYHLSIGSLNESIPVARSYTKYIRESLQHIL